MRAEKLASFVPKTVLYDEALSATKVTLVRDEDTDLVSVSEAFDRTSLCHRT